MLSSFHIFALSRGYVLFLPSLVPPNTLSLFLLLVHSFPRFRARSPIDGNLAARDGTTVKGD